MTDDTFERTGDAPGRCDPYASIVFLDFDGVTHREGAPEREWFARLPAIEEVLASFPSTLVVVSSTWRLRRSLEELKKPFQPAIAARVIGVTPDLSDVMHHRRELECRAWLRVSAHPWTPWVAIDDRNWLFRPFCPELISTPWCGQGIEDAQLSLLTTRLVSFNGRPR